MRRTLKTREKCEILNAAAIILVSLVNGAVRTLHAHYVTVQQVPPKKSYAA